MERKNMNDEELVVWWVKLLFYIMGKGKGRMLINIDNKSIVADDLITRRVDAFSLDNNLNEE